MGSDQVRAGGRKGLHRLLDAERKRSESLLLNILPAAIAERLKAAEDTIADDCKAATVLFADLVGFTELSRQMPAKSLVGLLNELYSRLDRLVEKHGVEKIKDDRRCLNGRGWHARHGVTPCRFGRQPGARHAGDRR